MDTARINGLVPMIRVADVERSAEFYRLFGFEIGNRVPRDRSPMQWAWLYAPKAADWKRGPNLMLTKSSCAIDAGSEDVLFYLYAADLKSLRAALLGKGLPVGGHFVSRVFAGRRVHDSRPGRLHADDRAVGSGHAVNSRSSSVTWSRSIRESDT